MKKMNAHSMLIALDMLFDSLESMKWQTKVGALVLLGSLGALHEQVVQMNLPKIILRLHAENMHVDICMLACIGKCV